MKKLKIFASGWFSMDGVVQQLVDDGHKVYTAYDSDVKGVEVIDYKIAPLGASDKAFQPYLAFAETLVNFLSVGGRPIAVNEHTYPSVVGWSVAASWRRKFIIKAMDKLPKLDAVIVHNDYDPTYGVITLWAQRQGIPVFCAYNGFSSYLHPKITGMLDYKMEAYYCLHGQFVLDYLSVREPRMAEAVITGSPTFDVYYGKDVEVRPNTFLYNITTNYQEAEDNVHFFAHPTAIHPWTYHFRPAQIDRWFFEAWAKYTNTINPDATLLVTLRPYHLLGYDPEYIKKSYGIKNVEVYPSDVKPFRELILEAEYFVGGISSTIMEGVITRTPTVFLCGTEPREDFFQSRNCYVETVMQQKSIVSALDYVTKVKDDLIEACNERAEFYNYKDDGKASKRMVAYIYDVLDRS
jgi:hypothetical protein